MSGTPSIRISPDSVRSHHSVAAAADPAARSPTSHHWASADMPTPRAQQPASPPVPTPQYVAGAHAGRDPGWQWGNDPNGAEFGRPTAARPGGIASGGPSNAPGGRENDHDRRPSYADPRRGSSVTTIMPDRDYRGSIEEYLPQPPNVDSRRTSSLSLQGERQLEQRTLEASSSTYDKHLLSRIGGFSDGPPAKRPSIAYSRNNSAHDISPAAASTSASAALPLLETERRGEPLRPFGAPDDHRTTPTESPATSRWLPQSAISPGSGGQPFWADQGAGGGGIRHGSLTFSDSVSQRGSYDQSMYANDDGIEGGRLSNLHIHDRSPGFGDARLHPKVNLKRRASSPPREVHRDDRLSISSVSAHSEIVQPRRSIHQLPGRDASTLRYAPQVAQSSASSSYARNNSLGSSLGVGSIISSATSYASGRLSPTAQPTSTGELDTRSDGASTTGPTSYHKRQPSNPAHPGVAPAPAEDVSRTHNTHVGYPGGSLQSYVCECCPKKPKRFETLEDLTAHEAEKQYTCAYCSNRFKNKNEAERHQNSLHLRRHSWSCAALAGAAAAFHPATPAGLMDACGYCGEEFPNPPQWGPRAEHLHHIHKFGECNQAKKFFRADHFRQHLKHSHAGTAGKWTNMLENACMKDEPLPPKRAGTATTSPPAGQPPPPEVYVSGAPPYAGS